MRGLPTHWGSRALAGLVAERDELPVAKLRDAGAVIFGKTNVPEFTMQGYTGNMCSECQNFTMVRNGTCEKCDTCGATSGCS